MAIFFSGWLGYGTAVQAGVLAEPVDTAYSRRPFVLGDIDSGIVRDAGNGTVGPSSTAWGAVGFAAIFDAQFAGNLLLWVPLPVPLNVQAGNTITSGLGTSQFFFPGLQAGHHSIALWPAGAVVAQTFDGRVLTAGVSLQVSGGQLAAQAPTYGTTVTMASLPSSQPTSGTGQLWNNGGIISVS